MSCCSPLNRLVTDKLFLALHGLLLALSRSSPSGHGDFLPFSKESPRFSKLL